MIEASRSSDSPVCAFMMKGEAYFAIPPSRGAQRTSSPARATPEIPISKIPPAPPVKTRSSLEGVCPGPGQDVEGYPGHDAKCAQ